MHIYSLFIGMALVLWAGNSLATTCLHARHFVDTRSFDLVESDGIIQVPASCETGETLLPESYEELSLFVIKALPWKMLNAYRKSGSFNPSFETGYPVNVEAMAIEALVSIGVEESTLSWCTYGVSNFDVERLSAGCALDGIILAVKELRGSPGDSFQRLRSAYLWRSDLLSRELPRECGSDGERPRSGVDVYYRDRLRRLQSVSGCGSERLYSDSELPWRPASSFSHCFIVLRGRDAIMSGRDDHVSELKEFCKVIEVPAGAVSDDHLRLLYDEGDRAFLRFYVN